MTFIVELFCVDEGYCDGKNCHDDCGQKPGILGLHPRAERDEDDGEISWHDDKHCTDRLRFYFEFHSKTMGVLPL